MRISQIAGRTCYIYECGSPDALLIQPVDDHDIEVLDSEVSEIVKLSGEVGFTLAAFKVNDWNNDLSPWKAPAVYGDHGFAGNAESTLEFIINELIPELTNGRSMQIYIGGYSLAAFFALWSAYRTEILSGVAAASPSVWFPGWIEYAEENPIRTDKVYLSLGDKEEKTRNPVMKTVGNNIRRQHELLCSGSVCIDCILEMNQGNHFKEPDKRTAKGFAWLLNNEIVEVSRK